MKPYPNIVWIVADELASKTLGCMGDRVVNTPHIDNLAANGLLFENAFCASPLCTPSRVSMFTGHYPHSHQRLFVDQDSFMQPDDDSLVGRLKGVGYTNALIGKNHCFSDAFLDRWFDVVEEYHHWGKTRGNIRPEDKQIAAWRHRDPRPDFSQFTQNRGDILLGEGLIKEPEPFPTDFCMTARIAEDAETFLTSIGNDPFFMKYSFPDPHWPVTVCEPYFSMYDPDTIPDLPGFTEIDWTTHPFKHFIQSRAAGFDKYTIKERKQILAVYYGMVTFIDDAVGRLILALRQNDLLENTIILFTSDHGCFAGQFGLIGKTGGFYDSLIRIPLIIKGPGIPSGTLTKSLVSNVDFTPTILDLLGLPVTANCQGRSFASVIKNPEQAHRKQIIAEVGVPECPPPPFNPEDFENVKVQRNKNQGWFWFIDYTTKGRSVMIRRNKWKYCYNYCDLEELYDLEADPYEMDNLAKFPAYAEIRDQLRNALLDWLIMRPLENPWLNRHFPASGLSTATKYD